MRDIVKGRIREGKGGEMVEGGGNGGREEGERVGACVVVNLALIYRNKHEHTTRSQQYAACDCMEQWIVSP